MKVRGEGEALESGREVYLRVAQTTVDDIEM